MIRKSILVILTGLACMNSHAQSPAPDYDHPLRPQFHFSAPENYLGDPAAVVYADSVFHLYFQYSPVSNEAIYLNMAHASSRDLLHWNVAGAMLSPDDDTRDLYRCSVRSGSALTDAANVLGRQRTDTLTQVIFYTSYQCGIRMAVSADGGKTWEKHKTPIIPYVETENARDPKVIWYEPTREFVLVLARKPDGGGEGFSFYTSKNLVDWTWQSHTEGFNGKPDLFALALDDKPGEKHWVLTDEGGNYAVGQFDGKSFSAETGLMRTDYGYGSAAATWTAGNRVIQIQKLGGNELTNAPFAGQLSFPVELRLKASAGGPRLVKTPVRELAAIQGKGWSIENKNVLPGLDKNPVKRMKGERFRITGTFQLKTVNSFGFMLRCGKNGDGTEVRYDATRNQLSCLGRVASLLPADGKIQLDILIDRSAIEVFANDGELVLSGQFTPGADALDYILYNTGGELLIEKLEVVPLQSVYLTK